MASYELESLLVDAIAEANTLRPTLRTRVVEALSAMQDEVTSNPLLDELPDAAVALIFQIATIVRFLVQRLVASVHATADDGQARSEALDELVPARLQAGTIRAPASSSNAGRAEDDEFAVDPHVLTNLVQQGAELLAAELRAARSVAEGSGGTTLERVNMTLIRGVLPNDFNVRFWARSFGPSCFSTDVADFAAKLAAEVPFLPPNLVDEVVAHIVARIDINDDGAIDIVELALVHPQSLCQAVEDGVAHREEAQRAAAAEAARLERRGVAGCQRCARLEAELKLGRHEVQRLREKVGRLTDTSTSQKQLETAHKTISELRQQVSQLQRQLTAAASAADTAGGLQRVTTWSAASTPNTSTSWARPSTPIMQPLPRSDTNFEQARGASVASSFGARQSTATPPVGSYVVSNPAQSRREQERLREAVMSFNDRERGRPIH